MTLFNKISRLVKFKLKIAALCVVTTLTTVYVPQLHQKYIRNKVGDATYVIKGELGAGTGFHVKAKSGKVYLLTNKHVCGVTKGEYVEVKKSPLDKVGMNRKIIKKYEKHDLCLIEAIPGVSGLSLSSGMEIGDKVRTVGFPGIRPLQISEGEYIARTEIELGHTIPKDQCVGVNLRWLEVPAYLKFIYGIDGLCLEKFLSDQISSPTYGGNSGSPVVNNWGNIVGVVFAGTQGVAHDGYLVTIEAVEDFLSGY